MPMTIKILVHAMVIQEIRQKLFTKMELALISNVFILIISKCLVTFLLLCFASLDSYFISNEMTRTATINFICSKEENSTFTSDMFDYLNLF